MAIRSKILQEIRTAGHCVLCTHVQPDGDALGSMLALGSVLQRTGVRCTILAPGPVPQQLLFMPLTDRMQQGEPEAPVDLLIALDCAEQSRIAADPSLVDRAGRTICIDHHRSNEGFLDLNWIDWLSGSTAEMVYRLIQAMNVELTPEEAAWLYVGLITDTGRFLYNGTSPESHKMAAHLITKPFDRDEIHRRIFQSMPYSDFSLFRTVLMRAEFLRDRQLAISWITADDFSKTGASPDQTDPALHALRDIEEVEVSCLLKEHEPGVFKISLRSKNRVDVSKIAADLGGGGHLRAAGGTIRAPLDKAKEQLLAVIDSHWPMS